MSGEVGPPPAVGARNCPSAKVWGVRSGPAVWTAPKNCWIGGMMAGAASDGGLVEAPYHQR